MPQLFSPSDIAVHYLSPFLVVMDTILFDKSQDYPWYMPFEWLLTPVLYFSYIVGRTFFHRSVPQPYISSYILPILGFKGLSITSSELRSSS